MAEFSLFPLLPLELRRQIWACTFSPQILEYGLATVHIPSFVATYVGDPTSYDQFVCAAAAPRQPAGPVALRVCHESRSYALEHYVLSAGGTEPPEALRDYPGLRPRPVYFNASLDVVGFRDLGESLRAPACWGPSRRAARGSYGAAPRFQDVKRLLLNASDWESVGRRAIAGKGSGSRRGPQQAFFTDFFPALEEILLAVRFEEPRRESLEAQIYAPFRPVALGKLEGWLKRCAMERDFRNIMRLRIPGWKPPVVRLVRSRRDLTEVVADDEWPQGAALETEMVYGIIKEYQAPPPPDYWSEYGVSPPETDS